MLFWETTKNRIWYFFQNIENLKQYDARHQEGLTRVDSFCTWNVVVMILKFLFILCHISFGASCENRNFSWWEVSYYNHIFWCPIPYLQNAVHVPSLSPGVYSPHHFNWHCQDGFWEHQCQLWWFLLAASHSLHLYLLEAVACLEQPQLIIGKKWKSFCNTLISH